MELFPKHEGLQFSDARKHVFVEGNAAQNSEKTMQWFLIQICLVVQRNGTKSISLAIGGKMRS
jgi:hypothetical protein